MPKGYPSREAVERVREAYPSGCRVELVRMEDPYTKLQPGEQGTVDHVDDIGTVFVAWDSGSRLGVAWGEDEIKRLPETVGNVKTSVKWRGDCLSCSNHLWRNSETGKLFCEVKQEYVNAGDDNCIDYI